MLTLHWLLTVTAIAVAVTALLRARRTAKKLERLTETYWELRYDHGQLRARLQKLDPDTPPAQADAAPKPGGSNFVPISSLKNAK